MFRKIFSHATFASRICLYLAFFRSYKASKMTTKTVATTIQHIWSYGGLPWGRPPVRHTPCIFRKLSSCATFLSQVACLFSRATFASQMPLSSTVRKFQSWLCSKITSFHPIGAALRAAPGGGGGARGTRGELPQHAKHF